MSASAAGEWVGLVTFVRRGVRFALEAGRVRLLLPEARPGRDQVDLAVRLQLSEPEGGRPSRSLRCLVVATDAGEVDLVVEDPVRLVRVPVRSVHPLPALVGALMPERTARALLSDEEGVALICDVFKDLQTGEAG